MYTKTCSRQTGCRSWACKGTSNIIVCFPGCLDELVRVDGDGRRKKKVERAKEGAMKEIDSGVYHTLDQVCIVGRKASLT